MIEPAEAVLNERGSASGPCSGVGHAASPFRALNSPWSRAVPDRPTSATITRDLRDELLGYGLKRFRMDPAVVLGQDLSDRAGPVSDGAVTDLATGDRKLGDGHGEAAGR